MSDGNPEQLKLVKEVSRPDTLLSVALRPESSQVYCGSSDFKVYDVDLAAEEVQAKEMTGHNSYVMGVALAGDRVVSGGYDRQLIWWDAETHEQVRRLKAHERPIRAVVASPDGSVVASIADDMICRLWDSQTGQQIHELRGHKEKTPNHYNSMLYACAFSPDGRYLATGDKVGHIVVWDTDRGRQAAALESPEHYTWDPVQRRHSIGGIRSLTFSPDGKQLAVGGIAKIGNVDHLDGKALVHVFDWQTGERTNQLAHEKHKGLVETLHFHHEGRWLLGTGKTG
jgi:WD40 repeat protein